MITSGYRDADLLNYELGNLIQKYRGVCIKLGTERVARMSCIEVKEQITAAMEPEYEFIDFIAFSNTIIDKTDKDATREWYQTALSSLCWFYNRKRLISEMLRLNG